MKIKVQVRRECHFAGSSYVDVEINEDEIKELAEKKAADEYTSNKHVIYTARELKLEVE